MDWTAVAIIFATFFGPIMAVYAQGKIDERRQQHRRRLALFHALMRTRFASLSREHVNALNAIPLEFAGKTPELLQIRSAWKQFLFHTEQNTQAPGWGAKRVDLQIDLLKKIGALMKYKFDDLEIEKELYVPVAHSQLEKDEEVVRAGLASLFRGEGELPMAVTSMPSDPRMKELMEGVLSKLNDWLDRQRPAPPASLAMAQGVDVLALIQQAAADLKKNGP